MWTDGRQVSLIVAGILFALTSFGCAARQPEGQRPWEAAAQRANTAASRAETAAGRAEAAAQRAESAASRVEAAAERAEAAASRVERMFSRRMYK